MLEVTLPVSRNVSTTDLTTSWKTRSENGIKRHWRQQRTDYDSVYLFGRLEVCVTFGRLEVCVIFGRLEVCVFFGRLEVCAIFGRLEVCVIFGRLEQI